VAEVWPPGTPQVNKILGSQLVQNAALFQPVCPSAVKPPPGFADSPPGGIVRGVLLGCGQAQQFRSTPIQPTPSIASVHDHPPLEQNVGQERGGVLRVREKCEVDRPADAPLKAAPELDDLFQVAGRVIDQKIDV
jgi:hypothetical protein